MAGPHRSPLIQCSCLQDTAQRSSTLETYQPTDIQGPISWRRLWGGRLFYSLLLRDKRLMVRTRSRATSPGHQGSRDASSNPHHDHQSAPIMKTSSVQHVQSMAAAMVELTRQSQELRMKINMRSQTHEEGGQTQSHGDRENTEIGS